MLNIRVGKGPLYPYGVIKNYSHFSLECSL